MIVVQPFCDYFLSRINVIDSLQTICLVQMGDVRYDHYGNEIEIIRQFFVKDWTVRLHHTFREGGISADVLAKLGARATNNLVVLSNHPI